MKIISQAYQSFGGSVGFGSHPEIKIASAAMARDAAPSSGVSISPLFALCGRPGIVGELSKSAVTKTTG